MSENIFHGIVIIAIGAFASNSFAAPFSKIRSWNWEIYWMFWKPIMLASREQEIYQVTFKTVR